MLPWAVAPEGVKFPPSLCSPWGHVLNGITEGELFLDFVVVQFRPFQTPFGRISPWRPQVLAENDSHICGGYSRPLLTMNGTKVLELPGHLVAFP